MCCPYLLFSLTHYYLVKVLQARWFFSYFNTFQDTLHVKLVKPQPPHWRLVRQHFELQFYSSMFFSSFSFHFVFDLTVHPVSFTLPLFLSLFSYPKEFYRGPSDSH